ncbi:MAG: response regulator [gamma proteobacterium symbiont of Taylorina sp.]|nr:response regulator [gamma proteobacterium symbiont of Taylorina sp.]
MKYKILCVDDNKNNLFTLKVLLEQLEHVEIITVLSGREALNLLLKQAVDLVILDIQMPEMDGFEVARLIKLNHQTKHIPVLFLTAVYKSQEFIEHGYELGAIDYLSKPIDDHLLLNKINLYLAIFRQRDKMMCEKSRFQHLAQSIAEGIYVLNAAHQVMYVNPKALQMLGYAEHEIIGKTIHNLIHYSDADGNVISAKECPIHNVFNSCHSYLNDNELFFRKDGSSFPVSIAAAPIQENADEYSLVVIFKDLTQIRQQELQAQELLKVEQQRLQENKAMVDSLVRMIDQRDSYTAGHTQRVAHYCVLIAREMGYSQEQVELLENAAKLHDIGKVATPDSVLLKPGRLNKLEYKLIKEHLSAGYNILKDVPNYQKIAEIMYSHHERFDGQGYPDGKKGYDIPLLSRVMIVADAFDAMTTNRIYKPRMSVADAIAELKELKEIQFHPEVVDAAVTVLADMAIQLNISQEPHTVLEQERFAYFFRDRLTGLYFSDYLPILMRERFNAIKKYFLTIRIQNFSQYNHQYGWEKGDLFLQHISKGLTDIMPSESIIFRVQGDDFLCVSASPLNFNQKEFQKLITPAEKILKYKVMILESNNDGEELELELEHFIN